MFMIDLQAVCMFSEVSSTREGRQIDPTPRKCDRYHVMTLECSSGTYQIPTTSMFVDDEERGSVDSNPADPSLEPNVVVVAHSELSSS